VRRDRQLFPLEDVAGKLRPNLDEREMSEGLLTNPEYLDSCFFFWQHWRRAHFARSA